jgi:lysophospholipase L1-like esterase
MNKIKLLAICLGLTVGALASPVDPPQHPGKIRVACVGDSITFGYGAEKGFSYPSQLQKLLGSGWDVQNFGVAGRTLLRQGDYPYWREAAFTNAKEFQPDVVIILLGTNDTKPQNWIHGDEFEHDYTDLVKIFSGLASKPKVYVGLPTPVPEPGNWGITETNIVKEMPIIKGIASRLNLSIIDMHAILEKKPQDFPDRVHPNNDGAAEMAAAAYQALTGKEKP